MPQVAVEGARVLVLGGSGALGSSIALELAQRGATVFLAGRNTEKLTSIAAQLGPDVRYSLFDLTQPATAEVLVKEAVESLGGLDGVVNAAGVVAFGPLAETGDDVLAQLLATNLLGPLQVIRAALPHLEGGFVINLTGVVAEQPVAGLVAYSAVKAGLSAATRALARELRSRGIHMLDARPPHTETGLATRPIAGSAPEMPTGLNPAHVAAAIVDGLVEGRRELPAEAFGRKLGE